MGHRAEQVRHQIQTKNSNKRADLGRLRHGIHLGRACRGYSNDARPPHLEAVRRRGRQCLREWCRANSDLSRRNRYRVCAQIWVPSLQQRVEYEAVIAGLNLAHSMEVDQLKVCSDSQLVVKQIEDTYEAKGEKMILYLKKGTGITEEVCTSSGQTHTKSRKFASRFLSKTGNRLPRRPQQTDARRAPFRALHRSQQRRGLPRHVRAELDGPHLGLLNRRTTAKRSKEASKLRSKFAMFTIHRGALYKQGFFTPILKCIAGGDADYVLSEVHEGVCGNHIGTWALAEKVLRQGYYWPTMLKDATELVKKCKVCQEHAKISHLPSEPLTSVTSPWPFQQWGLDILGPLPIGKGQCKFVVVAVDYFTKWAEAEPLATIKEQKVRNFVWRSIICRFGFPRALVSDNGKQFDNPKFRDFCAELGIMNYYSSPAHPQSNGQAEVTIRTLKAALKTKLEDIKGKWVEYLPEVL